MMLQNKPRERMTMGEMFKITMFSENIIKFLKEQYIKDLQSDPQPKQAVRRSSRFNKSFI